MQISLRAATTMLRLSRIQQFSTIEAGVSYRVKPRISPIKCDPYGQNGMPLTFVQATELLPTVSKGWHFEGYTSPWKRQTENTGSEPVSNYPKQLSKVFEFETVDDVFKAVQTIGLISANEGHQADVITLQLHLQRIHISLRTHALAGLSYNDFLLALKLDINLKNQRTIEHNTPKI